MIEVHKNSKKKAGSSGINQPNPDFLYRSNDILKVWAQYLKTKGTKFRIFDDSNGVVDDIFGKDDDGLKLNDHSDHAVILNSDGSLYKNHKDFSVSIVDEVDYEPDSARSRKRVIEKVLGDIANLDGDHIPTKHLVVFPYHVTHVHWNLGVISIDTSNSGEKLKDAKIEISIFDPFGSEGSTKSAIDDWIKSLEGAGYKSVISGSENEDRKKQQNDGTSCGAITAENGKYFLDDNVFTLSPLKAVYVAGAIELRASHMEEIKLQVFNKAQHENAEHNAYGDQDLSEDSKQKIRDHIKKCKDNNTYAHVTDLLQTLASNVDPLQEMEDDANMKSNSLVLLKELLVSSTIDDPELAKILFKDNASFQDGVYNVLCDAEVQDRDDLVNTAPRAVVTNGRSMLSKEEFTKIASKVCEYQKSTKKNIGGSNTDDFKEFIKDRLYVDKSLLIKEVIESKDHMFISAPQRWGKSLNLSMLKYFFQPEVDEEGNFDFKNPNKNRKFFEGGIIDLGFDESKELKALKIAKEEGGYYLKRQGQYPVIYLNFKCVSGNDQTEIENSLRSAVKKAYEEHGYLYRKKLEEAIKGYNRLNSNDEVKYNSDDDINFLMQAVNTKKIENLNLRKLKAYYNEENVAEVPLEESISFLSDLLKEYYNEKVFVLVDEFDKPVHNMLKRLILNTEDRQNNKVNTENIKSNKDLVEKIAQLVSKVVGGGAKGANPSVEKIILTGVLNTVDLEASATLNAIQEKNIMVGSFTDYFGFSKAELEEQVLDLIFANDKDKYKKIIYEQLEYWYNGYNIANHKGLFAAFSIMRCLTNIANKEYATAFKPHWSSSTTDKLLSDLVISQDLTEDFKSKLLLILEGNEVSLDYEEDETLYKLIKNYDGDSADKLATQLLLKSGYLTLLENGKFSIPGNEIKTIFITDFLPKYLKAKELDITTEELYSVLESNAEGFKKYLEDTLLLVKGQHAENYFQALMFSIFHGNILCKKVSKPNIDLKYEVFLEQNVHHGGRIDTIFFPTSKAKNNSVIIHEYKKLDKNQSVEETTNNALWQILLGKYTDNAVLQKRAENSSWANVKLRAITFYKDYKDTWQLKVEQESMTFSQIEVVQKWINNELEALELSNVIVLKPQKGKNKSEYTDIKDAILKKCNKSSLKELLKSILKDDFANSDIRGADADNISKKGVDKLTLDELKKKINELTYPQKGVVIKKLEDAKKESFTKKEALEAIGYKEKSKGYQYVKEIFEQNLAMKKLNAGLFNLNLNNSNKRSKKFDPINSNCTVDLKEARRERDNAQKKKESNESSERNICSDKQDQEVSSDIKRKRKSGDISMQEDDEDVSDDESVNGINAAKNKYYSGLTTLSIKQNIISIINSSKNLDSYIEPELIDADKVPHMLANWTKNIIIDNYFTIAKIKNNFNQNHAILIHAKRTTAKVINIIIIDPLSESDSEFKEALCALKDKIVSSLNHHSSVSAEIVYTGVQDSRYGTCADMSLIILRALSEGKNLDKIISYNKEIMKIASEPQDVNKGSDQSKLESQGSENQVETDEVTTQNSSKRIGSEAFIVDIKQGSIDISSLTSSLDNIEQKMRNIGYDPIKKSGLIKIGSKEDITLQELEHKHNIISELQTELKEKLIQSKVLEEYEEPKNLKHASSLETTSYNKNIRVDSVLQAQRTSAFSYISASESSPDSNADLASDSNTLVLLQTKSELPVQRSDSSLGWFRSVMLRYVFSDELKQVGEVIGRTKSKIDRLSNPKLENTLLKDPTSWDKQDQKAIKLVLHPDKNGNSEQSKEDFQLVNGVIQDLKGSSTFSLIKAAYSKVSEKVEKSLGITESAKQTIAKVGDIASKATTVLKAGELVIDSVRMVSAPTVENAEKVVLDSAHLYSSIKGLNYFSVGVTAYSATRAGIATASPYWESGEYASAALYGTIAAGDVVVKSAMYIAIPMVLAYANPVLGTGYTIYIAGYTGYHVYSSASLLYHDLTHEGQNIRENIQYLSRWSNIDYALSWTPLQLFHDFADSSKFYENEMQKKIKVEKITETLNNLNNKSLAIKQDLYEQNKVGVWKAYSHSISKDYALASLGLDDHKIEHGAQDSLVYLGEKIVCGKIIELSELKEYKCYDSTFGNELGNIILNSDLYIVDHHLSEAL